MTCIVGLKHKGKVYIGGDSAGVGGYSITARADGKVFTTGDFIMGFTTSFRMGQVLQYGFSAPKRHPETDIFEYMVTDFIDAVRDRFKKAGYSTTKDGAEVGGTFLVGYEGRLFRIDSDYQVGESRHEYDAVGCGEDLALGSLHSTQKIEGRTPKQRITDALEAATEFSAGVCAPFKIENK